MRPPPSGFQVELDEWAYIREWNSDTERSARYEDFYNRHRTHGALG